MAADHSTLASFKLFAMGMALMLHPESIPKGVVNARFTRHLTGTKEIMQTETIP